MMVNNEFKRMQQLAGLTEIKIVPGSTKVYKSVPASGLYKVKNFPQGNIDNARVKEVLDKITQDLTGDLSLEDLYKHSRTSLLDVIDNIDALRSRENVYVYLAGSMTPVYPAGNMTPAVVDSLDPFNEEYQTENGWGIESWEEI